MRVAIIHEWLDTNAGSEKVVSEMLVVFPSADLLCVVDFLSDDDRRLMLGKKAQTTFIQKLPFAKKFFRHYLALMPVAIEQLDVSGYDLVLSSSHAVAKGVLTGPDQLHICYCHSPMRYAWDLQHQYLHETGLNKGLKGGMVRWLLHRLRQWDVRTANGVDFFIANSRFIGRRIEKVYRRSSEVIYPPVNVGSFDVGMDRDSFYLTASRMVPYKKVPLIVQAFAQMPDKQLVVIGDGPDFEKVKALAHANVHILGYQSDAVLKDHMQRARAFVFAAEEDFGITPVEAQACGTPVIAFGKGGALETIRGLDNVQPTGVFYTEQSVPSLVDAVHLFEAHSDRITPQACRANAMRFSQERFRKEFLEFSMSKYHAFQSR